MASEEETNLYGVEPGCPTHGDEKMRECSMCGAEFCRACHPRSTVCPDCAEPSDDEEEEEEADFEDVNDLDEVLEDDEEDEKFDDGEDELRGGGKDREY